MVFSQATDRNREETPGNRNQASRASATGLLAEVRHGFSDSGDLLGA
jgi:hypothetical protein